MKRTFIAIPVPPADDRLLSLLHNARKTFLTSKVSWTDLSMMHLTLSFLGDTDEGHIPSICETLRASARDCPPFVFGIAGAGFFGSKISPRVLWAGISAPDCLFRLQVRIVKGLSEMGISTDEKKYSPHLTIGRIRTIDPACDVDGFLQSFDRMELQETEVREFLFLESILLPAGPLYKVIERFPLTGI
jgi:RNA 2',3'-cyclic 3'-phosphodiesterase